ncbi:MAG: hypothetical protein ACTSYJ_03345 [Candidatus Thorarchaeota archaeon]
MTSKTDIILTELRDMRKETQDIGKKVAGIETHLNDISSKVQKHETQIQLALDGVDDNKVRIAKYLGASFGGGGVVGIMILALKCLI